MRPWVTEYIGPDSEQRARQGLGLTGQLCTASDCLRLDACHFGSPKHENAKAWVTVNHR